MRTKFIAPLSVVCTLSLFGCAETLPKELADARAAVARLDREALQRSRPVNRALAAELFREAGA